MNWEIQFSKQRMVDILLPVIPLVLAGLLRSIWSKQISWETGESDAVRRHQEVIARRPVRSPISRPC